MTAPARWSNCLTEGSAPALRVTVSPVPAADPLALFARHGTQDAIYWAQPSAGRAAAGIGVAATFLAKGPDRLLRAAEWWRGVIASATVEREAGAPAAPLCFGGASFDPIRPLASHWRPFGGAWFVVPAVAVRVGVQEAVSEIRRGQFDKLVLAREVIYTRQPRFDAVAALARLTTGYPSCTTFAFAREGSVFLGATPERLARLRGRELRTMCLAGSAPRGADPVDDSQQAAALLIDEKERHEHAFVVAAMREALAPLCHDLMIPDEPVVASLPNVHHLETPVLGWLRPAETIFSVVDQLHPTPAVCGAPRETAIAAIRRFEAFDRGWFAGPVGWLDSEGGEFVVALRSALIAEDQARLFAGCGIVAGSDADRELRETDLKLLPMRTALALEDW